MTTLGSRLAATRDWLASIGSGGPPAGLLEPIDVGAAARRMELTKRGVERGQQGIPPAVQTSLDEVEQSVVQDITSAWTVQKSQAIGTIRALEETASRFNVAAQLAQLRLAARDGRASFAAVKQDVRGELARLRSDAAEAAKELAQFRAHHRLSRPARDRGGKWTVVGLLIFLIGVESILNGTFFQKGSQFGLIGGIGTAIGISLCNVIALFVLGLTVARYLNHRSWLAKLIALLACTFVFALMILLHGFAAHLRDATAAVGEVRAYEVALAKMFSAPWALSDLSSWYLLGLGILFGLAAFWKGYRLDDPYPGYGAISWRARAAEFIYDDARRDLLDELRAIRENTIERFDDALTALPHEARRAGEARADALALAARFATYEDHLEECANTLLSAYRDSNRSARSDACPPHFAERWRLLPRGEVQVRLGAGPDPVSIDPALTEIRELHDELLSEYEALLKEAERQAEAQDP
jgi:hypothetical protein